MAKRKSKAMCLHWEKDRDDWRRPTTPSSCLGDLEYGLPCCQTMVAKQQRYFMPSRTATGLYWTVFFDSHRCCRFRYRTKDGETEAAVRAYAPRVVAVAASITTRIMLSLSSVNGQKIVACVPTNSLLLAIKGIGQSGGWPTDRIFDA